MIKLIYKLCGAIISKKAPHEMKAIFDSCMLLRAGRKARPLTYRPADAQTLARLNENEKLVQELLRQRADSDK